MNPQPILRSITSYDNVVASSASTASLLGFAQYSSLMVRITSIGSMAGSDLLFYASPTPDGTFYPVILSDGTAAKIAAPTAGSWYAAPPDLFGCTYVKLVPSAGSGVCSVMAKG
jgi:hypothetical protein